VSEIELVVQEMAKLMAEQMTPLQVLNVVKALVPDQIPQLLHWGTLSLSDPYLRRMAST